MSKKKLELLFSKCSSCGDDMHFDADGQCLTCPSCKSKKEITKTTTYQKHQLNDDVLLNHNNENLLLLKKELNCLNCGALISVEGYDISAHCPYCNTSMLLKSIEQWGLKPDAIIPFSISKGLAGEIFKAKIKKNWLVPKSLKKSFKIEDINAFYYPSFVFGAKCSTEYNARVYDIKTTTDKDGKTRSYRSYSTSSGQYFSSHQDVIIETSTKFTQEEILLVRPYDFTKAVDYSNDYVFGYDVESYSSSVNEAFDSAHYIIKGEIERELTNDLLRYNDGVSSLNVNIAYINRDFYYCFLPIYRTSFKYKDKSYSNVINGQTGAFGGKLPKSGWKISLIVLLPILAIMAIILLTLFI
ncbi:MAG: hypothetical protein E7379_02740 [Clostridiales bacterium]|nr:hypothetical protein [Clostridiales bacterium]